MNATANAAADVRQTLAARQQAKPQDKPGQAQDGAFHRRKVQNRIEAVIAHIPWYSFKSQARLARDLGFSKSAVSRLLREECSPSLALAYALTQTLEKRLGQPVDLRELFTLDGTYPTPSACHLVGCANCLPAAAYDREDNLRPEYKNVAAGQWSVVTPRQSNATVKPVRSRQARTRLRKSLSIQEAR